MSGHSRFARTEPLLQLSTASSKVRNKLGFEVISYSFSLFSGVAFYCSARRNKRNRFARRDGMVGSVSTDDGKDLVAHVQRLHEDRCSRSRDTIWSRARIWASSPSRPLDSKSSLVGG